MLKDPKPHETALYERRWTACRRVRRLAGWVVLPWLDDGLGMNGERVVVHYSGHVQGVGFRFTTRRIAVRHPVSGFVRNLPDGRVLMVAEGPRDELNRFLAEISSFLGRHIDQASVQFEPMTGEFQAFEIRH